MTAFIGKISIYDIAMPSTPDRQPIMPDSAMNTLDTSSFLAPILLNTPISFFLSMTDVYIMIAIIIDETIRDIAAKPMSTPVMVAVIDSTYAIIIDRLSLYFTGVSPFA